jgi:hypothetical protein
MKAIAIATLALTLLVLLVARADDHEGEDALVHELMERTHEGRKSPYVRLGQAVEGSGVAWAAIEQAVQGFEPMSRALLESKNADIKDSADGYVDAVKEVAAAVKRRDAEGVRAGFASLRQSCGDCHFKGGVGGELEHEREHDRRPDPRRRRERRAE